MEAGMKLNKKLAIALLAVLGSPPVDAADGSRGSAAPASPLPVRNVQTAPLKGELHLNPAVTGRLASRVVVPKTNLSALTQRFNELPAKAKDYETIAQFIPEVAKHCSAKPYSIQDQTTSGCTANDTVAQCQNKLLKHCVETFSLQPGLPGFGGVGGLGNVNTAPKPATISTKQFKPTGQATAAEARALSQQLILYANQVEHNAKALMP
jgi:hypothetical protein